VRHALDLIPGALAAAAALCATAATTARAIDHAINRRLARRRATQATGWHDQLNIPAVWRDAELAWLHAMWPDAQAEAAEPDPHKEH
jgi:2-methylcitrate dehydratase PrpD